MNDPEATLTASAVPGDGGDTTQGETSAAPPAARDRSDDSQPSLPSETETGPRPAGDEDLTLEQEVLKELADERKARGQDSQPVESQPGAEADGADAMKGEPADAEAKPKVDSVLSQDQEADLQKAFNEWPEWKGILTASGKNADKVKPFVRQMFQRARAYQQQAESLKSSAKLADRIKASLGDDNAVENAILMIETFSARRPEALKMLDDLKADLQADLNAPPQEQDLAERLTRAQKRFEDGLIDEATLADIKQDIRDIAEARKQVKGQQSQRQKESAERLVAERTTALNDWEKLVPLKNPDYANRQEVRQRVLNDALVMVGEREAQLKRPLNGSEMVAVAQQAYDNVLKFIGSIQPKPQRRTVILPGGSPKTTVPESDDPEEAGLAYLRSLRASRAGR